MFNSHNIVNFPDFAIDWLHWRSYSVQSLPFKIYWGLTHDQTYGLSWKTSYVHLRRMCVLLLSVQWMSVRASWFIVCLSPLFAYLTSCVVVLAIILSAVFKSYCIKYSTIIVESFLPSILSGFASCILMVCHEVHVYNCCIFLFYWTFYEYTMFFLVSCKFFI